MKIARNTLGAGVRPAAAGTTTTKRSGWLAAGVLLAGLIAALPAQAASITDDSRFEGIALTVSASSSNNCAFIATAQGPGQSQYQTDYWSGAFASAQATFDNAGDLVSVSVSVPSPSATTYGMFVQANTTGHASSTLTLTLEQNDLDVYADAQALCNQSQPPNPPFPPGGPTGPTGPFPPGGGSGGTVPTTLSMSPDGGPAEVGTAVGLLFIVDAGGAPAGGSVQLYVDDVAYGDPADVLMNFTSIDVTFDSTGNKVVKAVYSGDSTYAGSTVSETFSVTAAPPVNKAPRISTIGTVSVAENATTVVDVDASDDSDSEGSGLTYSISSGADSTLFSINTNTGVLSFKNAPDFESPSDADGDNVYEVEITVSDSAPLTNKQRFAVTVTDVVEVAPNKAPSITTGSAASVAENTTYVMDVDASDDSDSESNGLTYSISGGKDSALFTINSGSGALSFIAAPDFESPADDGRNNVYNVEVTVTDSGFATGALALAVTVTDVVETRPDVATTLDLSSSKNPAIVGDSVDFTATVLDENQEPASGTVTFFDDKTELGSVTLDKGSATYTATGLALGPHPIYASFKGTGYTGSSDTLSQVMSAPQLESTTVAIVADDSWVGLDLPISFEVKGSKATPEGSIDVTIDSGTSFNLPLVAGKATYTASGLALGKHTIKADYSGSRTHATSSGQDTQDLFAERVSIYFIGLDRTIRIIDSQSFEVRVGGSRSGIYPTGTVKLLDNGVPVETQTVRDGSAYFSWQPTAAGSHRISAEYTGSNGFSNDEESDSVMVTADTSLDLATSKTPATLGETVTFTATVTNDGTTPATGNVTFKNGSTQLGVVPLDKGIAKLDVNSLPEGPHTITASFAGSDGFDNSSDTTAQVIQRSAFKTRIEVSGGESGAKVGDTVTFTATVLTDTNVLATTGTVELTVGGGDPQTQTADVKDGKATFTTTLTAVSNSGISASYSDKSGTYAAASTTRKFDVAAAPLKATRIEISGKTSVTVGETVTYVAKVFSGADQITEGEVTFVVSDASPSSDVAEIVGGEARFTTRFTGVGSPAVNVTYWGDERQFGASSNRLDIEVGAARSTSIELSGLGSVTVGEEVTYTAKVFSGSEQLTSGSVVFGTINATTNTFTGKITDGVATFVTTFTASGDFALNATFSDDGGSYESSSSSIPVYVDEPTKEATTVTVTSSANPATAGSSVRFTVAVAGTPHTPDGKVNLSIGGGAPVALTLSDGSATYDAVIDANQTITATYQGTYAFAGSSASISQQVNEPVGSPTTELSVDVQKAYIGQRLKVLVKVNTAPGFGRPTGSVTLRVDGGTKTIGQLINGRAVLYSKGKLTASSKTAQVIYGGDGVYPSDSRSIKVKPVRSLTNPDFALIASETEPQLGTPVTLTATVGYEDEPLEGAVEFSGPGAPTDPVPVVNGKASVELNGLVAGDYEYSANFVPDDSSIAQVDATVALTVIDNTPTPVRPAATVVASPNPSLPGEKVTINVTSNEMSGDIYLRILTDETYPRRWNVSGSLVNGKAALEFTFDEAGKYKIEGFVGNATVDAVPHEVQGAVQQSSSFTFKVQQVAIGTSLDIFDNPDVSISMDMPETGNTFFPDRFAFNASLWAIQEASGAQKRSAFNFWLGGKAGTISSSDANGWTVSGALGADYMFSPQLIGGLGLMFDRVTIKDRNGTDTIGNGWIATPYLKGNITDSLAYKLQAGYGRVTNEVTPLGATYTDVINGDRKVFSGSLVGTIQVGDYTINPSGSVTYFDQTMEAFTDGQGNAIPSMSMGTVTVTLSPAISRRFDLDGMALTLGGNLQLAASASNDGAGWAFSGLRDGAGISLSLALPGGATFRADAGVGGVVLGDAFTTRGSISLTANIN